MASGVHNQQPADEYDPFGCGGDENLPPNKTTAPETQSRRGNIRRATATSVNHI